MEVELISTSCLRVFKTSKLLGIPKTKFYLETGVINIDNVDGACSVSVENKSR